MTVEREWANPGRERRQRQTDRFGRAPDDFEWIIYDRISDDRHGEGIGVANQQRINRDVAERLGGQILVTLTDNDLTANTKSRRYKPRPEYNRLCQLLREKPGGRGVIAVHTDRLHRSPRELEDFIDLCEAVEPRIHTLRAGSLDLTTAAGRKAARDSVNTARHESELKSERVRDATDAIAMSGGIAAGGPRPFGYERIYLGEGKRRQILRDEIHSEEAPIVRELTRRFIAGDTLRTLVQWLNLQGIKTTMGNPWSQVGLRTMLMSARIAGLRETHGVVVAKAVWPAIITEEEHEAMRQMLTATERPPGSRTRIHYLSGQVYCSDCAANGVKMRVGTQHKKLVYKCPPDSGGCNGRVIGLEGLVEVIDQLMIAKLSDPETLRELAARDADTTTASAALIEKIEADERRLKLLQGSLDEGDEDDLPEVLTSIRHIRRRMAATREELSTIVGGLHPSSESLPELARRWRSLDLDQKQSLLRLFYPKILILPARRGVGRFDPDRIVPVPASS